MEHDQTLLISLAAGVSHCAVAVTDKGNLLLTLLATGLAGGLSHCGTMCGPFVLSQVSARMEAIPVSRMREWHRLAGAALLPYHLGRSTTYMILGALGAALDGSLSDLAGGLRWLSVVLLLIAAVLLIGYALPQIKIKLPGAQVPGRWWSGRMAGWAKPLFSAPVGLKGYLLGLLLGFMPCGLLYGALTAAASTGDPVAGALGMGAFVLGTVPTLFAVGLLGHLAGQRWRVLVRSGAPVLLLLNAGVLTWLAVLLLV